ncbi:phosphoribosylamine/glycine ligase [Anaeromyxobacter dehalogenans 2CP-1]|uniref:Phosphoribosylamine--glycine ligase n=1 Tax=Anaeromyxobacter dehalogenans (strain ATCC BAA-258 / DSM 21875 / 2CP-1) TaxID=455488 RepID=B8JHD0_ANAD2|nr:phosphoribosylamine--glycine ligase [Anaeromyxobacter dehalogenans]ACL64832.1 phosphoribosylamine/glycine ligase [Anaeromyxobacter dehalogenans 2CP-1]
MRVLVVGSGGREHALAWKISRSPLVRALFAAPGNPGIARVATLVPLAATDVAGLVAWVRQNAIDLVVVGPEAPLVAGLVDRLQEAGVPAFGPAAAAAEIEGSKAFAKDVMRAAGIPTAEYETFEDVAPAVAWARARDGRVVVKADGLAAGKGVVVCGDAAEAEAALRAMLVDRVHGGAGARVVVEERLEGPEASCICFTDGERVRLLAAAQDHKRIFDGDRGPNTGGMGAFSPTPNVTPAVAGMVERDVLLPAVRELARRGRPFRGALYAGLMLTPRGPRVLEFNARLGDPETQPILLRMASDVVPALLASARGDLSAAEIAFDPRAAVGVVLAAEGYPGDVARGDAIDGLDGPFDEGVQVFHAGTAADAAGRVVTSGGRVLTVCALGRDLDDAAARAYAAAGRIRFRGMQYRKDIGKKP